MADADVEEEQYHFQRVIGSFMGYEAEALIDVERTRRAVPASVVTMTSTQR